MLIILHQKAPEKFTMFFCDFTCCKNSDMKRHNLTLKHENAKNANSHANFGDAENNIFKESIYTFAHLKRPF
jgi:hypothetical protein